VPVTARLSQNFYERFGDDIANELVNWFNMVDDTYRMQLRELNELNFARFDAKMEERFAQADARLEQRFAQSDARLEQRFAQSDARLDERFAKYDAKWDERFTRLETRFSKFEGSTISAGLSPSTVIRKVYVQCAV